MAVHLTDIKLENISSNETLDFPVLFVRGKLICGKNCSFSLKSQIVLSTDNQVCEFDVQDGHFKCIIELKVGQNLLKLTFNDDIHSAQENFTVTRRLPAFDKILKLIYIIPKDDLGTFQSKKCDTNSPKSACERIVTGAKLLQTFIAERLREDGFGRKTFQINLDSGLELCEVFYSQYSKTEFLSSSSEEIWSMTARELLGKGIFTQGVKVLAFLSCTEYSPEVNQTNGYVACGRGHLAMVSSSGLHSWASSINSVISCLTSQAPIDSTLLDDSGFRGTLGGCYATSLGAALHEIGHIFDLVHSDCGIMARGFNDLDLFFSFGNSQNCLPAIESIGRKHCQTISIRTKPATKVTFVSFGFQSNGNDKELGRDGQAYFHRSAAVLLSGHPWLNECSLKEDKGPIQVCGLEVKSPNALRLIELHEEDDHLVKYWDFSKNPVKIHRYSMTFFDIKDVIQPSVLVQDFTGKISVQKLNASFIQNLS